MITIDPNLLLYLAGLVAAVVGIIGNTWNPKGKGLDKLTPLGRIALLSAITVAVLSIISSRENQREAALQQEQQHTIRQIAHSELARGVATLTSCLEHAHYDIDLGLVRRSRPLIVDSTRAYYMPADTISFDIAFSRILDTVFISDLGTLPVTPIREGNHNNASETLAEGAKRANDIFSSVLGIYAQYLDAETIIQLNSIFQDYFFNTCWLDLRDRIDNHYRNFSPTVDTLWLRFYWFNPRPKPLLGNDYRYRDFVDKLRRLTEHIGMPVGVLRH